MINNAFVNAGTCQFKDLPVNELFSYHGEIFLKLNDSFGDNNSFNIRTLNFGSIPYGKGIVEHLKLKKESNFLLKISYSWGETEPDQEFDTFEHAWEHARRMALNEAETASCEQEEEIGLFFQKYEENQTGCITLHYQYDDTYCYYTVVNSAKKFIMHHSSGDLLKHLNFWCNGCGDLHYNGKRDIQEEELPDPLKQAYHELWSEGAGCLEYLVDYDGIYYLAIEGEYIQEELEDDGILYRAAVKNVRKLLENPAFSGCMATASADVDDKNGNAIYFLVPALTPKEIFDEMEKQIIKALDNEE